jgi:Mn2+/Fe2+ NRAMP family transporter
MHVQTDTKFYTTWTNISTIVSLIVLIVMRGNNKAEKILKCSARAFLVNAIVVGLLGAFTLAYKKKGISQDEVQLKLRSNFWQHALPSFVATIVLFQNKEVTDLRYLSIVLLMQVIYFCVPYNGKVGLSKFDKVYDSVNPFVFLTLTNVILFATAFAMKFRT